MDLYVLKNQADAIIRGSVGIHPVMFILGCFQMDGVKFFPDGP